jgi:inner membrane protein
MDSLTQLTCGASVGELVLGRKVGRKAALWGAILGTLPDLDVLIPLGGPVADFVYHRGFSHSLLLLAAATPILAWLITRIHPSTRRHLRGWMLLTFLVLQISVLLDLLTVYGTQILWPIDTTPRAWPVLFIIDPLFTLPMLVGLAAVLITRRPVGRRLHRIGLALSLLYVLWAVGVHEVTDRRVRDELARRGVAYSQLSSTPAPFNTLLFRYVGIRGDRYFETYRSVFDGDTPLSIRHYPRHLRLLDGLEDHPPVAQLRWFTRGMYAAERRGEDIVVKDLRMGSEPNYVFRFKVARVADAVPVPTPDEQLDREFSLDQFAWVWRRIWEPIPTHEP